MLTRSDQSTQRLFVAATGTRGKIAHRCFAGGQALMWIVAGEAGKRALALQEATGLAQPVSRTRDLKFVIVAAARGVIEVKNEILQRLAGKVRKRPSIQPANPRRPLPRSRLRMPFP